MLDIALRTIFISAFSSTTTLMKSTSPTESKRICAVLKSKSAKEAPPGEPVFANSAIPTIVKEAGIAPASTVTLSPTKKPFPSAVVQSITTSCLFVGGLPSISSHCVAYGDVSHAAPKVGAKPFCISIVSLLHSGLKE